MEMKKSEDYQDYFARIVGEQLSAVSFVMDYLQLQFDAYSLTVLTQLTVLESENSYRLGDLAYRDVLCERITHKVKEGVLAADHLQIGFDINIACTISLT